MVSINTNLSSLITQGSLRNSTSSLNQAIERMTTGFKINGAKDNAANYSISTNMTTRIGAYEVAESNVMMGLDLLSTATSSLDLISSHLTRLRALAEQAANGTYGDQSLSAIQSEATARLAEVSRIMTNTEYNGIKLFGDSLAAGFIEEVTPLTEEEALAQGYTVIKTADELQAMQDDLSGKYILMNDIDLSGYDWEAVGTTYGNPFKGEFNGNGHVIKNLTINKPTSNGQGLFGCVYDGAVIKNVGLENVDVTGNNDVGGLVGNASRDFIDTNITNCYVTGNVTGTYSVGGLVGYEMGCSLSNCYTTVNITGSSTVGGLVGDAQEGSITNSYSTGSVTGNGNYVGGLTGYITGTISNSYATGNVTGTRSVGGLVGYITNDMRSSSITNSYATGNVTGANNVGGLFGMVYLYTGNIPITSCYYNTQTSGQTSGIGAFGSESGAGIFTGDAVGVTTSELNQLISDGTLPSFASNNDDISVTLQIGIDSSDHSSITFDTNFSMNLSINLSTSAGARAALTTLDEVLAQVNGKQTELGAVTNRLESALDEISIQYEKLVSSRSTLRDADIAEVSSEYIKMQILQQASATLLATANQSPSIALQLI